MDSSVLGALAKLGLVVLLALINGFFVIYFRIHSLIVTLGMGTFIHGLTLWFSDTETISGVSMNLVGAVIITRFLGIPLAFYYAFAAAIVIWYVFSYTALGQHTKALKLREETLALRKAAFGDVRTREGRNCAAGDHELR